MSWIKRKPRGVDLEICKRFLGSKGLMKNPTEIRHYGNCRIQCFWSLTHAGYRISQPLLPEFF